MSEGVHGMTTQTLDMLSLYSGFGMQGETCVSDVTSPGNVSKRWTTALLLVEDLSQVYSVHHVRARLQ